MRQISDHTIVTYFLSGLALIKYHVTTTREWVLMDIDGTFIIQLIQNRDSLVMKNQSVGCTRTHSLRDGSLNTWMDGTIGTAKVHKKEKELRRHSSEKEGGREGAPLDHEGCKWQRCCANTPQQKCRIFTSTTGSCKKNNCTFETSDPFSAH